MHFLDVLTILCSGLMIGNELAVSLFVNPAIWKLNDQAQASLLARSLGKAMPFWYALCLILLGTEAYLRREEAGRTLLLAAAVLWAAIIVYTIFALVPINNRVGASLPDSGQWRQDHNAWDKLHRWRILFLTVAMLCFLRGILR